MTPVITNNIDYKMYVKVLGDALVAHFESGFGDADD